METTRQVKLKQKIEKKQAKEKENQITISKLKKENAELQRQIGFLGEVCRRCHSTGSVPMGQRFSNDVFSSKSSICEKCDITRCKYSGHYKEPLVKENQNNGMHRQMNQNPLQPGVAQSPYLPNSYGGGFMPQQW